MSKKHFTYEDEFDEEEELLLDRKAKRKRERERQRRDEEARASEQQPQDDTMSRVVALCQENRWREAELECLQAMERYRAESKEDSAAAVEVALKKIDRSLRRQMIASFVNEARKMLNY